VIHSKHNGSRTKEQKAVQLGWATGGGLLRHRRISLHWHKQLASRETGIQKREPHRQQDGLRPGHPLDAEDNSHLHYV
jgi:hypothetical protein